MKFQLLFIATFSFLGFVFANSSATTKAGLPHLPRLNKDLVIPNLSLPYNNNDNSLNSDKFSKKSVMDIFDNLVALYSNFPLKTIHASMMITKAFIADLFEMGDNIKNFDITKLPEKVQKKVKEYVDEITSLIPIFVNTVLSIINELPNIRSISSVFKLFTKEIINCFSAVFKLCYNLYEIGIPLKNFLPNTTIAIFDFVSAIYSDLITFVNSPFFLVSFLKERLTSVVFNPLSLLSFY